MSYLHCRHCGRGHDPQKVCGCPESLGEAAAQSALLQSIIVPHSASSDTYMLNGPKPNIALGIMKCKWLADTGDVQIPCMNPECLPELDVSLSPSDTPNLYMGSCPDCYTGYKLEIFPPK